MSIEGLTAREKATAILSAAKYRMLESAGLTVVEIEEIERLRGLEAALYEYIRSLIEEQRA
jgi:hypothetical protein